MGWTTPLGVTKLTSTTSGVDVGLKRAMKRAFDPVVTPVGKYHCCAVPLWQGASAQPDAPCTACETATPPPVNVTDSESHVPDLGVGTLATSCPRPGTETGLCTFAPVSVTPSIVPVTAPFPVFVRTSEPGASWPAAVVCPVQYHADDSASGAPAMAAGLRGGPPVTLFPRGRAATPTPTNTASTTTIATHLRWPGLWAGLTARRLPGRAATASPAIPRGPRPPPTTPGPRPGQPAGRREIGATTGWPIRPGR